MTQIASRVERLAVSQTLAMSQKSRELQDKGADVINLSVGQPDFPTPEHIKQAAVEAIKQNYTGYTPVPGYADLLDAIVAKLKRDNQLDYTRSQIVVSNGAKHSLANILLSVVEAGDEVIVPAPYWVSYVELVKLAEGKNVVVPTTLEESFKITPEKLRAAITPKTKAMFLCSPSNPTGSLYTRDELRALADVIKEADHPIYIISDEIYELINYVGKHESIAQFSDIKDQVIVVNGVSKGYSMTGWRIGYIAAPEWLAKACNKVQGQMTSGACSISQKASVAALSGDHTPTQEMLAAFRKRRDLVAEGVKEIPGFEANVPQGAFYLFPKVQELFGSHYEQYTINNANDLCMYLLETVHVAMVPGEAFGAPGYLRLSYAASEKELKEALQRIKKAVQKLTR
ncbi:MAG: pyridoxal phosphate-dependent aminotransferase [Bacteroidales bacterium]